MNAALTAPATARNREPILQVLREVLPPTGTVLEIASGTGEHAVHFAQNLPGIVWQPSDPDAAARGSIAAWAAQAKPGNLRAPLALDAASAGWPGGLVDAVVCINMIHISPWAATQGLMRGAAGVLPAGGVLYLYGPFIRPGHALEPGNAAFDADLRLRNAAWGLRNLADVEACAAQNGLTLEKVVEMPANNLSVIFRRA